VELLIAIAIISVLAGLLFPVFASARNAAKSTTTLSQLSQIGQAMTLYAVNANDVLPYASGNNCFHLAYNKGKGCGVYAPDLILETKPINEVLRAFGAPAPLYRSPLDRMSPVMLSEPGHKGTWFEETTTTLYPGASYEYTQAGLKPRSMSSFADPSRFVVMQSLFQLESENGKTTFMAFGDSHVKAGNWATVAGEQE
jgi:type II secretory pathway pseudopilin PulG